MSARRIIAWDTETDLIRPGVLAPELACLTWQVRGGAPQIASREAGLGLFTAWLRDPDVTLVGHNVAFDIAVMMAACPSLEFARLVFAAYDAGRIQCTQVRGMLLDIADGCFRGRHLPDGTYQKLNYGLDDLHHRALGYRLDKDTWRLRYGILRHFPLEQWPEGARVYPLEDARATLAVWEWQERHPAHATLRANQDEQARAAFALHLMSAWGMRTNPVAVEIMAANTETELAELRGPLVAAGLVRADGSRDMKAITRALQAAWDEQGKPARLTESGKSLAMDEDACEASGSALLQQYAVYTRTLAVLAKDVPLLRAGKVTPIQPRFGMAESGRTTCSSPNLQNIRGLPGLRECFVPREGFVFCNADYDQLELRTLGQVCLRLFGASNLAVVLNQGIDPHSVLAYKLAGIVPDKIDKDDPRIQKHRKLAKVANFGFPGGMGAQKIQVYAANKPYRMTLDLHGPEGTYALRNAWMEQWPEVSRLFQHTDGILKRGEPIEQLFSRRLRLTDSYSAACNTWFQGLGADATKRAAWLITRACYAEPDSPLFGSRPVNYVHDEFIVESPHAKAPEAAEELARLMKLGADEYMPDVPTKTEPLLMPFWSKDAKRVTDSNGRLIPWQPKPKQAKAA